MPVLPVGVCVLCTPGADLEITVDELFDTDGDPRCREFEQPGDGQVCLLGTGIPGLAGAPTGVPTPLRGGCSGGSGADESGFGFAGEGGSKGAFGGAVAFYAAEQFTLAAGGSVRATGAAGGGGVQAGGGGGGSGGMIFVESATIMMNGDMGANGGGGEGGIRRSGQPRSGSSGDDGAMQVMATAEGTGLDRRAKRTTEDGEFCLFECKERMRILPGQMTK
ncbi:MAG: hypothetical protein GY811_02070 [Myxococcales bacterium]|nr:hypothetical protein [Myxococcales bacterium]